MNYDLRPLDRLRSLKTKLGVLVAATITAATLLAVLGTRLGLSPWATVPVAVLVALAITQVLARGMTSPLREMTAAATRMARGDYTQRVQATSRDEVGELARAFNRMATTLEQIDQQRRDLVANVSHELRTPISALQAVLENLVDGVSEPEPATLQAALTQTERLGRLVADLLDLSRIDAGVAPLRPKDIELRSFLTDAVAQARVDGIRYSINVTPDNLTVPADPERLHQLVANLLDNASRHSPSGGTVAIHAHLAHDRVAIDVSDEGPGIPPGDRASVFERFTTSSAHSSGTGLGLAISRWVAQLHHGAIEVVDAGDPGCRIRVALPTGTDNESQAEEPIVSTLTPPAPVPVTPAPPGADLLTSYWPEAEPGRPRIVAASVAAGIVAALVLPHRNAGIGTAAVFGLVSAIVLWSRRRRPWTRLDGVDLGLVVLLLSAQVVLDAVWATGLCVLAALGVVLLNVTRARSFTAVVAAAAAVPLAGLRGLPWLGRSLRRGEGSQPWWSAVRTAAVSAVLLLAFGALFASADAVFAAWVDAVTPTITWNDVPMHVIVGTVVAAGTLAAAFVALVPPVLDRIALPVRRSTRTFEWLAPVLVVDTVFAVFLLAQLAALFGGHEYLRRTTGLTYAAYVHQGFGQLTVATILTLTVVGWAARKAAPGRARDAALGALGLMTLVVVWSALYRMHVYEEAYGFTQLRLLVSVFEAWLGAVVLVVLIAGLTRRSGWVVPLALRLGAAALLGLAAINPDLYIAQHNIERVDAAVEVDWSYLGQLSADAYPALVQLPEAQFVCATANLERDKPDDWLSWNLSRARTSTLMDSRPPASSATSFPTCSL